MVTAFNQLRSRARTVWSYGRFVLTNVLARRRSVKPRAVVYLDRRFPDIHDRRYFFLILQTLVDGGYNVDVVWKINFRQYRYLYRTYEGLIVQMKRLRFVSKCPPPSKSATLFTNLSNRLSETGWQKVIELDCDMNSPRASEAHLRMPYFMHPEQYKYDARQRISELRKTPRRLRIFFSGNLADQFYSSPLPGNKLTRREIVEGLRTMPNVETPADEGEFREMFSRGDGCLIHDRQRFAISDEQWLPTIASCDFFLCLPGSRMPMCHNVIEAMAVGTIPVLNYGEWFDPPLKHAENCIEFNSLEELRARVREILELPPDTVKRLRQNVIDYYETHLSPAGFRSKLEQKPYGAVRLLVNTEYPWHPCYQAS